MADDINPAVAVMEPPAGNGAATPAETTPAKEASTPAAQADWKAGAEGATDDELMELLEKRQAIKDRLGQSHADKVLLKDRERIAKEVETRVQRDFQEKAWQDKWNAMSPEQQGLWLRDQKMAQEQHGRTIRGWWAEQSQSVKQAIPELKDKAIEAWDEIFQKHPESWGQTMAALIEEVVGIRLAEELKAKVPGEAKTMAEALLKEKVAKTLASGQAPDLKSSGGTPAGTDKDFVKDYATGRNDDHGRGLKWYQDLMKS